MKCRFYLQAKKKTLNTKRDALCTLKPSKVLVNNGLSCLTFTTHALSTIEQPKLRGSDPQTHIFTVLQLTNQNRIELLSFE